jgi:hypothetical protein
MNLSTKFHYPAQSSRSAFWVIRLWPWVYLLRHSPAECLVRWSSSISRGSTRFSTHPCL